MSSYMVTLDDTISPIHSVSISTPAHLSVLAESHNILPSGIVQLAWYLVLRCYLGTSSPIFGTVDITQKELQHKEALAIQWRTLNLDGARSISWVLRNWGDSSIHRHLTLEELRINDPGDLRTVVALARDSQNIGTLEDIHATAALVLHSNLPSDNPSNRLAWSAKTFLSEQSLRIARSLDRVFHVMFLNPNVNVGQLDLFGLLDHEKLLKWNFKCPEPVEHLVHEMFQETAATTPQAIAVAAWDGELTYRELDRLSSRLAVMLHEMYPVEREDIIVLCFEKSVWAVVAMLGVLKVGAAFLHLDPNHPSARHQAVVETAAARLIVCSEKTRDVVAKSVPETTFMVVGHMRFANEPDHDQQHSLMFPTKTGPKNAAYVVCTSGSTGTPKAIVVEHLSLCTSVTAQAKAMAITRQSRILQYAAYTFDVSVGDIFTALTHGACVCVPSDRERTEDLSGAINRLNVNQACLTSTVASFLIPAQVPTLQKLTLGGEPATQQCLDLWSGKVALQNVYGPAECTVWCAIQPNFSSEVPVSNIGHSMGARAWVVHPDSHDQLMPIGAIGELLIEGPLVARGYLNDAEKTAAVFLEKPPSWLEAFGPLPSRCRFYKTGDLAVFGSDGTLDFKGRKDTQIKLRGQRIELGDIEHRIYQALGDINIAVAVDLVHFTDRAVPLLCVFITRVKGYDVGLDTRTASRTMHWDSQERSSFQNLVTGIRNDIDRTLPSYMMPGLFIPVSSLPLNSSGKLDRQSLRHFGRNHSYQALSTYTENVSDTALDETASNDGVPPEINKVAEETLAQLWSKVLGKKTTEINRKDNFIALGGDSITAMRLVSLTAEDAQLTLTVANIFKSPVLCDQAGFLKPLSKTITLMPFALLNHKGFAVEDLATFAAGQCGVSYSQVEDVYPSTPLQDEMIRDSVLGDRTQVGQEVVQLSENIDLHRFQAACGRVHQHFPILRTRFVERTGVLYQVIIREELHWEPLKPLEDYMKTKFKQQNPLGKRLCLWALTPDKAYFIWAQHHAIFDAISLSHILGAIYAVYQSIPLIPPSIHFSTFLDHLDDQELPLSEESRRFWISHLSPVHRTVDLQPLSHTDHTYTPKAEEGMQQMVKFENGVVSALQKHRLTEATLARGAWAYTLAQKQNKLPASAPSDVVFATMLTGRNISVPSIDTLVAPTLTHVPIRVRMSTEGPASESPQLFLARIQADATAMIPFEHDGMNRIRSIDDGIRTVCHSMRTLLVIQSIPESLIPPSSPFPGTIVSGPRIHASEMGNFHWYELLTECTLLPGEGFFIRASYDSNVFTSHAVASLLEEFSQSVSILASGLEDDGRGLHPGVN